MKSENVFEQIQTKAFEKIKKEFPAFTLFSQYPKGRQTEIELPCMFLEMVAIEGKEEDNLGNKWQKTIWELKFLISSKKDKRRKIWSIAARLNDIIDGTTWGLEFVDEAKVIICADDGIDPFYEGIEMWKIEFTQLVLTKESDLDLTGFDFVPEKVSVRQNTKENIIERPTPYEQ